MATCSASLGQNGGQSVWGGKVAQRVWNGVGEDNSNLTWVDGEDISTFSWGYKVTNIAGYNPILTGAHHLVILIIPSNIDMDPPRKMSLANVFFYLCFP